MIRWSGGQPLIVSPPGPWRRIPVRSATDAFGSAVPSALNASVQSDSRSSPIPVRVRSSTGQPIEYSIRRPRLPCAAALFNAVRWLITSWEAPAPSIVTSTSVRHAAGIWAIAASSTTMWSDAVKEPALPGRSITARLSPTLLHHAVSGWNPKPPL